VPGWPEPLEANPGPVAASKGRGIRGASDEQLARAAGRGDVAAFESLYERYHLQLLSFSRHMVGRVHDAEDVVQHTFMAADRVFRTGKVPKAVRAWLYTVARNRCISVLRARRDEQDLADAGLPSTENLAADVEQRVELRELLADLRTLPDDQRAALLLSELGDLSHVEVAEVIGVRAVKVKALVFQARQNLMAAANARSIPCHSIREELAVATGSALRRRHLRNHLAQCEECSEFSARVRAQRASLAALLPVVPTVALRDSVLGALGSGGAAAAGAGGASAGFGVLAAKSTAAKVLAIAAFGGAAAGGGTVAVNALDESRPAPQADRSAQNVRSAPADAAPAAAAALPAASGAAADTPLRVVPPDRVAARDRRRADRKHSKAAHKPDSPSRNAPGQDKGDQSKSSDAPPGSRGRALGHARQQTRGEVPPGQARRQARGKATPPGQAKKQAVLQPKVKQEKVEPPADPPAAEPAEPPPAAEQGQVHKDANAAKGEAEQIDAAAGG
jgi:RNA polymerase sigma factor (sigma-70 family)